MTVVTRRPGPAQVIGDHVTMAHELQTRVSTLRMARLDRSDAPAAANDLASFLRSDVVRYLIDEEPALYGEDGSTGGLLGSRRILANRRRLREHVALVSAIDGLTRWRTPLDAQLRADRLLVAFDSHIAHEDPPLIEAWDDGPVAKEIGTAMAGLLEQGVKAEHQLLAAHVAAATNLSHRDPIAHVNTYERLIVALCRHAAVVTLVLYPAVHAVLTAAERRIVADLAADLRAAEAAMLRMERIMHGDVLESPTDFAELWARVEHLTMLHFGPEEAMVRRVAQALPLEQEIRLLADLRGAHQWAPTRPHPHAPHVGGMARLAARVDERLDQIRNALDSRIV